MNKETFNSDIVNKSLTNSGWDFFNIEESGDDDDSSTEDDAILAEVTPYIEKIEPRMLKKVFDGWKNRRYRYRKLMREEEDMAELSDAECNVWADLFYLGTVFRDYLDTILNLKMPGKSGFQLLDSTEKEVEDMGSSMGWFNTLEHMVSIVGDRFDSKFIFLGAIAHEMWHAHQIQTIEDEDNDKSDIYMAEFRNYIGVKDNPEQNKNQLLEKEAYAFQNLFKQRLLEAMKLAPEMKKELLEELNNKQDIVFGIEDYMRLEEINRHYLDSYDDFDFGDDWN